MFLYQVLATCSLTPVPYPVLLRSTGLRQPVSQAGLLLTGMRNQYGLIKAQKQLTERLTEVLGRSSENGRNQDWPPSNHRQYQASGYTCVSARRWQTPGAPPPTGNRMLQPLSCPAARAPSHVSWESRPKQEFRAGMGPRRVGTCVESPGRRTAARRALSVLAPLKDTDQHCYRK